tara:strand:- start:392 stop:3382 length:2991 start_codon:yes stop_codon:yes gene_type:complete
MGSITQTVPYYIQGISEQPDQIKKKGQVRDALNVLPDITQGLLKRPGSQYLNELKAKNFSAADITLNTEAAWFSIDQTDKFIGRVHTDGSFAVWSAQNGNAQNVSYTANNTNGSGCGCSSKYLAHSDPESIQFLTINDATFVVNREKTVRMLPVDDCRYYDNAMFKGYTNPNWGRFHEAFIDLKHIKRNQQYPLDLVSSQAGLAPSTGTSYTRATKIEATWISGPGGSPNNMEIRNVGSTKYTFRKTFDINPSPTPTGGSILAGTTAAQRNLRFELTMTGMPYSEGTDYHSVYRLEWDLMHGGYGWQVGDHFEVSMGDTGSVGYYRITIKETETINHKHTIGIGPVRPMPTSAVAGSTVSADSILDQLKIEIEQKTNNYFSVTKIGTGLYLKLASLPPTGSTCRSGDQFNVLTSEPQVMNILTHEVSDVSELPNVCKDGYLVKVVNSTEDDDDHWLKFVSDTPGQDGSGHWEETWDPCVEIDFDPCTMPHKIVRLSNNVFDLQTIPWEARKVGDENTNPKPSFVDKTINNLLFYRNRLTFLSEENVILSQAGDYYNFWVESATAVAPIDVIDIAASSDRPTILYDGCEINEGLAIFSPYEQFLVTTEETAFTSTSASVRFISSYDYNIGIKPFVIGSSVGFTSNSGSHSRFWQMGNISRTRQATTIEQSKSVANSLPSNLLTAAPSRDNNIILFHGWDPVPGTSYGACKNPYSDIWGYRYFSDGEQLIQSAWFRWDFYGDVIWHTIMDNTYYVVVYFNSKAHFLAVDLEQQSATFNLDDQNTCNKHLIHLDNASTATIVSYNATTNKTTITLPANHYRQPATHGQASGGSQILYGLTGAMKGQVGLIDAFTANTVTQATVEGNWVGSTAVIGFTYDMSVEFPSVYVTKPAGDKEIADLTANLNIHRVKFTFGPTGYHSTVLSRKGVADYTENHPSSMTHTFKLNQYNVLLDTESAVPVYADSNDYRLKLLATHPTPCTLYSQTWEGNYNPNYYKRA